MVFGMAITLANRACEKEFCMLFLPYSQEAEDMPPIVYQKLYVRNFFPMFDI